MSSIIKKSHLLENTVGSQEHQPCESIYKDFFLVLLLLTLLCFYVSKSADCEAKRNLERS